MGNRTSRSRLTDEAELAMFNSSLEDIKSRFATLLISVREALEAHHYHAKDVRAIVVEMFTGSDDYIPNRANLEGIFRAATRHKLWDYLHHSPVENLLRRCLPNHISLIREYKEHLSGYCTTTKLISYIKYANIDHRQGRNELPFGSYTREQCQKLMVTLDIQRNITEFSLKYVQDLWGRFAEEFDIPFLTAVIDSILSGSLVISWLIPRDIARKIVTSACESIAFFEEHHLVLVKIETDIIYSAESEFKKILKYEALTRRLHMLEIMKKDQEELIKQMKIDIEDLKREQKESRSWSKMETVPAHIHSGSQVKSKQIDLLKAKEEELERLIQKSDMTAKEHDEIEDMWKHAILRLAKV